jgi:AMMECR1 domain-containing protein
MAIFLWGGSSAAAFAQEASGPSEPQLSPSLGSAAAGLARQAMLDYLGSRISVDSAAIPESAKPLTEKTGAVAVSLRGDGLLIGRAISQEQDLARGVISAALAAMRDFRLPDVVTADYVKALTIEVEVLGPPKKIDASDLEKSFVPGLTGVKAVRGVDEFVLLPSASCLADVSAEDVRGECLSHLPPRTETASLPALWSMMASSHYVGYPGGATVWLRQGRAPLPPGSIEPNSFREAAETIGLFLLRHEANDGSFSLPRIPGMPPDHAASAWGVPQLHATYAMARLAKATGRKDFRAGANLALARAAGRLTEEQSYAYLIGIGDEEQLASISLLVLAIGETPPTARGTELSRKLLAMADKALLSQLDPPPAKGVRPVLPARDLAMAYLASSKAEPNDTRRLESIRKALAPPPASATAGAATRPAPRPIDGEGACWVIRAGLADQFRWGDSTGPQPHGGPAGLARGFAMPGRGPDTLVTALSAVNLAEGRTWPGLAFSRAASADIQREDMILSSRRLCRQMIYGPREAYFAAKPETWAGGVRASPQAARVTLTACAAAIEALLGDL